MIPTDLNRGDLIQLEWLDAVEDPIGNPNNIHPAIRTSYALYWDRKVHDNVEFIITTTTVDKDVPDQQGGCAYPIGMVKNIKVIKRLKRRKKHETTSTPTT